MKAPVFSIALATIVILLASRPSHAQSAGEATYKSKCQMCHGVHGLAESPAAKAMKVKPINDPAVQKLSLAELCASVKNGKGKMTPFADKLTDQQIRESTLYLRSLAK